MVLNQRTLEYLTERRKELRTIAVDKALELELFKVRLYGQTITINFDPSRVSRIDLVRYGSVVDQQRSNPSGTYSWKLTEPGVYIVRISLVGKSTYRQSAPYAYFPDEYSKDYRSFLAGKEKQASSLGQSRIDLRIAPDSMPDMLLASWTKASLGMLERAKRTLKELPRSPKWRELPNLGGWNCAALTFGEVISTDSEQIIFSGETIVRGRYIDGAIDLPSDIRASELLGGIGPFAIIAHDGERCIASRDLNNYFQQYYYQSAELMLVSPSYHLLLLAMSAFGLPGELNVRKAAASLLIPGSQILEQNFSYQMDIEGAHQLPVDKDLCLDADGWRFTDNKFAEILKRDEPFDDATYKELLVQANNETREYIDAVFEHSRLSKFILNLTGGIDSRYLLALLAKSSNRSRIHIHSYGNGPTGIDDVRTAVTLAQRRSLPFDTLPKTVIVRRREDADQWSRSEFMGRCWRTWEHDVYAQTDDGRISFIGAGGESLTRPEYGARCFRRMADRPETIETVVECFCEIMTQAMIGPEEAYAGLIQILKADLDGLSAGSAFERLETHYLAHRQSLHFTLLSRRNGNDRWFIPMQSPTLLRLHHMTYERFRSPKLMFDLIAEADPELLDVPFAHDHYNNYLHQTREDLSSPSPELSVKSLGQVDIGIWERANEVRRSHSVTIREDPETNSQNRTQSRNDKYHGLLLNLRELLLRYPNLERQIGRPLYFYITNNRNDDASIARLYSKVTSLVDQTRIFAVKDLPTDREKPTSILAEIKAAARRLTQAFGTTSAVLSGRTLFRNRIPR